MWDHLVVDLRRLRGMGSHHEHFIEVEHQIGKTLGLRFAPVKDLHQKLKAIVQARANSLKPEVVQYEREINQPTRKRPSQNTEALEGKKQKKTDDLETLLKDPTVTVLQTILELHVESRKYEL